MIIHEDTVVMLFESPSFAKLLLSTVSMTQRINNHEPLEADSWSNNATGVMNLPNECEEFANEYEGVCNNSSQLYFVPPFCGISQEYPMHKWRFPRYATNSAHA